MNLLARLATTATVAAIATLTLTGTADAASTYKVEYGGYFAGRAANGQPAPTKQTLTASCREGDKRTQTELTGTANTSNRKQTNTGRSSTLAFTVKAGATAHPIFTLTCKH